MYDEGGALIAMTALFHATKRRKEESKLEADLTESFVPRICII
jgi:hypothetical protein